MPPALVTQRLDFLCLPRRCCLLYGLEPRLEPPPLITQRFDLLLCRPAVLSCNIPLTSRLVALPLHQVKGEEG